MTIKERAFYPSALRCSTCARRSVSSAARCSVPHLDMRRIVNVLGMVVAIFDVGRSRQHG
jgi:hypothetical protein